MTGVIQKSFHEPEAVGRESRRQPEPFVYLRICYLAGKHEEAHAPVFGRRDAIMLFYIIRKTTSQTRSPISRTEPVRCLGSC